MFAHLNNRRCSRLVELPSLPREWKSSYYGLKIRERNRIITRCPRKETVVSDEFYHNL